MILILLSTYQGAPFLEALLNSLLAQTVSEWRLLVRDDGSKDATMQILEAFAKRDVRILIHRDHLGNLSARKSFAELFNMAQWQAFEYLMFCDQDDVWLPEKIAVTFQLMQLQDQNKPQLVHTDLMVTDEQLQILDASFWHYQKIAPTRSALNYLLMQNNVTGCTMMINRPLYEKVIHIPAEAIMHDWWIALVASAFGEIHWLTEGTIYYRQHGKNDTGAKRWSLWFALKSFQEATKMKVSRQKKLTQAGAFLAAYQSSLSPQQITVLTAFSTLAGQSFWRKRYLVWKYQLWSFGLIRNIGFLLTL